jgi:pathogenesis-related protein 1
MDLTIRIAVAAAVCVGVIRPAHGQAFTAIEIQQALDAHNQARCLVNPPAASMPPVTWDPALARVAQGWATRAAQFSHNPNRTRQYAQLGGNGVVGENLSLLSASLASIPFVVGSWVGEARTYSRHAVAPGDAEWSHYTQIIWAGTRRIGCGKAPRAKSQVLYVCNYAPAGNVIGHFPYTTGRGTNRSCSAGQR